MRCFFMIAIVVLACSAGCNPSPANIQQETVQGKQDLPATPRQAFGHESKGSQPAYQASGDDTWDTANELLKQIK